MNTRLIFIALLVAASVMAGACGDQAAEPRGQGDVQTQGASGATGFQATAPNTQPRGAGALRFVRQYYELVDHRSFGAAWPLLPPEVQTASEGFEQWKDGYRNTLSTDITEIRLESLSSDDEVATVAIDLLATDSDACTGATEQKFSGAWTLTDSGRSWDARDIEIEKIAGRTPILDAAECPDAGGIRNQQAAPAPAPAECDPNYSGACLDPNASDYDCSGGTGDGPEYTGQVRVIGSDPYGLDADADGTGCE